MSSLSDSPSELPQVPGFALHWAGPTLVVHPEYWRNYDYRPEDDQRRQTLVDAITTLRPQLLIVNLDGVPFLPAVLTGTLVRLLKIVDGVNHPNRMALVHVEPGIVEYLRVAHLDRWLATHATEAEALRRLATEN